jgi:YihY family inner membrane protein
MNAMDSLERVDAFQRRHRVAAFVYAVQKKFGDDNGGYLAALITYYGFLSIFPLLLAGFTIAAYALSGDSGAVHAVEKHLGAYPILGPAAQELEGKKLQGSPVALVAGVLGLLWGATGLAQAVQHTMDEAWNVPVAERKGMVPRLVRGFSWYAVFALGIVASTFLTSLGSIFNWAGGPVLSALIALVLNMALFWVSFWIVSPPGTNLRQLMPGAVFAGLVWTILTTVAIGLTHRLAHTNTLYGSFAPVLALLAFLYLAARITIYSVEANVVAAERLWPRSLTNKDLGPADRKQLTNLARRSRTVAAETVTVKI